MTGRSGIEELRLLVRNMGVCNDTFLSRYTIEELIQLFKMQLASEWDFQPDHWTERQVAEALAGIVPQWADDETPLHN